MKIVFVGPSLPDAAALVAALPGAAISLRPPARRGDLHQAVEDGATALGLIDGLFEQVAPVWHKEILLALSRNIPVLGAASMGALRAVECAPFGMRGIGRIFEDYRDGRRVDDGDVALQHGPEALGYPPLSLPLVNVDATLDAACAAGAIRAEEAAALSAAARALHFKIRTWRRIAALAKMADTATMQHVLDHAIDQKRQDAIALLNEIALTQATDFSHVPSWTLNRLHESD